ncbi:hypothetical protein B2G71_00490 [Novosphingobium sp. PC22D]|uniref:hypothetical protein n=1 Tax=Novosphingobium sp. PC22D TaxID=1962403 RepID=UPI000BFAE49C|nr:hypothetical protein [Novosphingobium sp. PC22D]PEQ14135.1 hypothetical protein B2G71_00490 [Novosphingobium sp. PC22D]
MADKSTCGAQDPAPTARKHQSWRKPFLAELANSSNVKASAKKAGISPTTVYEARRSDPEFHREWQEALFEGYEHLEMNLLERLRTGEMKPATGAKRGVRTYDNATAFRLLVLHRESAARQRAQRDNQNADAILASIDAKIDKMRERAQRAARGLDDKE